MHNVLIHEATFARISDRLKPFEDQLSVFTMSNDSRIGQAWGKAAEEGAPWIVHGNTDVWFGGAARAFMSYAMKVDRMVWFQSSAAGLENPALQAFGGKAEIYTSSHVQSDAIAEWVLWAGLDFFGNGAERRAVQASGRWTFVPFRELSSTRWMIVGFGHIGAATASRLKALGAHVTGVRRSGGTSPHANKIIHPDQMLEQLGDTDAVLLCCPHTPETEDLANAAFFSAMKDGSLFLNVGRGALVNEGDLMDALDKGRPAHATLDVVREEPLPPESPIWAHPNITLTSHTSANTQQSRFRNDQLFVDNLTAFLSGGELRNVIDPSEFDD